MSIFRNLPNELIHIILLYDGKIKYRNGKYMNQILRHDTRYKILQTIPTAYVFSIDGGFDCMIRFTGKYTFIISYYTIKRIKVYDNGQEYFYDRDSKSLGNIHYRFTKGSYNAYFIHK
jgi:hypothetical protein